MRVGKRVGRVAILKAWRIGNGARVSYQVEPGCCDLRVFVRGRAAGTDRDTDLSLEPARASEGADAGEAAHEGGVVDATWR